MSYVTVPEIAARIGRALTDLEAAQVNAWIEDLDALVYQRMPDLDDRIARGEPKFTNALVEFDSVSRPPLNEPT